MATFSPQQDTELNAANQRIQSGSPGAATATNAGDVANVSYAKSLGWTPSTSTSTTPSVSASPSVSTTAGTSTTPSLTTSSSGSGVPTIPKVTDVGKLMASSTTQPFQQPEAPTSSINSSAASFKAAGDQLSSALSSVPATPDVTNLQTENKTLSQKVLDAITSLGGKGQALQTAYTIAGIPDLQNKLADVNTQISQKSAEFNQAINDLSGGTGLTTVIQGKQGLLQRQKAIELGGLTSLAQALQGNITAAKSTADQAVNLEFEDRQNQLDQLKAQLDLNYQNLSRAEQKQADQLRETLGIQQQQLDLQKTDKQNILNLMIQAAQNGADNETLNSIRMAPSVDQAAQAAAPFLKNANTDFGIIGTRIDPNTGLQTNMYGFIDKRTGTVKAVDGTTLGSLGQNTQSSTTPQPGNKNGLVTTSTGDTFDIGSYATDPNHVPAVQNILNSMGQMKSIQQMDQYIQSIAPGSPITGQMIANASQKYGVSWEAMMAIMQQDSSFGTKGKAVQTINPGNVGNTDNGSTQKFSSWQSGVDAVAKNLAGRVVDPTQAQSSYKQYGLLSNTNFNPNSLLDKTAKQYIDYYIKNASFPSSYNLFGRSSGQSAISLSQVASRAQELYYNATGSSLPDVSVLKGNKDLVNANNKLLNSLNIQEGTVGANFKLAIDNLDKNGLNQNSQPINAFLDSVKVAMGDPNVAQYIAQNATLQNEVGSLLALKNAGGGATVHDKLESSGLIPKNASVQQQEQILKTLLQEAENGFTAIKSQNTDLYQQIDPLQQDQNNPIRKASIGNPKDRVNVIGPDGTPGDIPRFQLNQALQSGFKIQ